MCPPKPELLLTATRTARLRGVLGVTSSVISGSGVAWLIVGGMHPSWIAFAHAIASTTPAAPSMCPVADLVELTARRSAWSPKTARIALASFGSLSGVDVPCALT